MATATKTFTVSESVAREVLTACGLKGVEGWKVGVLTSKLKGAAKAQGEGEALDDKDLQAVLDDVKGALEDGEEVFVGAAGEAEAAESNGAQKPKKKEEGVSTATAEKPKRKATTKPPAGGDKPKKVGVVATIVECLNKASKTKPVTKARVLEVLVERFPDRDPKGMKNTVSGFTTWIPLEKKGTLETDGKGGFWMKK